MIAIIPVVIALTGLVVYLITSNGKAQEVGRILFFVGAFFTVAGLAGQSIKLF